MSVAAPAREAATLPALPRQRREPTKWAVAVAASAALAARLLTGPHPIDDAFITFRYARNLAQGLGLDYNPGELVLGTTTPAWALLLAGGYRLGFTDLPSLALLLSAICDAATAALLTVLALRLGWDVRGAALVGLAWALNPVSIAFAAGGMETSVFSLLMLAALSLAAGRSASGLQVAAFWTGIGVMVRPESAIAAATVVGWTWFVRRRSVMSVALCSMVPALAAGAVLWLVYGSPIPHSVAAKQVAYAGSALENLLAIVVTAGLPGWSNHLVAVLPHAPAFVLALIGTATLGFMVWVGRRDVRRWWLFAAFAGLVVAFYTLAGLRGARLFAWYLVPLVPFYVLAVAAGLLAVGRRRRWWLAALLVAWQVPAIDWRQPLLPAGHQLIREQVLLDAGAQLRHQLPPDAVVAAPEIGAVGYASNLRILDTVGLVSPEALAYYPPPGAREGDDNAIPPRLIEELRPDAVVTLDQFARAQLLHDPAFQRDYRLAWTSPAAVWRSQELLVFVRNQR